MKLAIMQPYFIPYIGYFQLINYVDKLVILDDVNFIKGGWINRNRLCVNSGIYWITVPVLNASQNIKINAHDIDITEKWRAGRMETIRHAYKKTPFFEAINNLTNKILSSELRNLSQFVSYSVRQICDYLSINTEIAISSISYPECSGLSGQDKIASICEQAGADIYVNLSGGKKFYDRQYFRSRDLDIRFIKSEYDSMNLVAGCDGVISLSIIDLLMRNSLSDVQIDLRQFSLS